MTTIIALKSLATMMTTTITGMNTRLVNLVIQKPDARCCGSDARV